MTEDSRSITGLILDSNEERRIRLKSATQLVPEFTKVTVAQTLRDAQEHIRNAEESWDIIFMSNEMDEATLGHFIESSKNTSSAADAAYILILNTKKKASSDIFSNMRIGIDGLLYQPYSIEQLMEIIDISAQLKQQTPGARESAAIQILLNDVIGQLDRLALLKKRGYDVKKGGIQLEKLCANLSKISPEELEGYFKTVVETFENAPLPTTLEKSLYKGPSQRVREMQERRLLQKLERF